MFVHNLSRVGTAGKFKLRYLCISDCDSQPPSITNGTSESVSFMAYSPIVHYFCDSGFKMEGDDFVTCQADGTWPTINGECVPIGKISLTFVQAVVLAKACWDWDYDSSHKFLQLCIYTK